MQPVIAQSRKARFSSRKKERKEGVGEGRERKGRKGKEEGKGIKRRMRKRKGGRERERVPGVREIMITESMVTISAPITLRTRNLGN